MQVDAGLMGRDFFSPAGSQAVEFHSLEMLQLLTMFEPLLRHKYVSYNFFCSSVCGGVSLQKRTTATVFNPNIRGVLAFFPQVSQVNRKRDREARM